MLQSQCLTPISNNIPSPRQDALFKAKIDCQNGNPQEITNPLGLKALFVRNVNRNVEAKELLAMFTKYGNVTKFKHFNEKSRSAFVCYDTAEAAVKAVKDLYHFRDQRLCYDPTIAWMFRFAPGDDQCNVQTLKDPQLRRKVVESSGECFDWRVGDACQRSPCPFKHTTINFNIDSKTCESQVKRHR
jgi:RNA recognition motif-containing protein